MSEAEPIYDPEETRLVDALAREFPRSFHATLRKHPDAKPVRAPDGRLHLQLGEVDFWLGEEGRLSFGAERGGVLHTGYSLDGECHWDDPVPLGLPEFN